MTSLAHAIDTAINEHLWDGSNKDNGEKYEYSCPAISRACFYKESKVYKARALILSLGCTPNGRHLFDEFTFGEKRQYARALWLTWAAVIAREEEIK